MPVGLNAKKKTIKDLPEKYRKWLEEEVVYIITSKEKDVFLQLETDRERDLLIEAFWKQRDPTPGTPKNEFKEEHSRRINYANHWFGKGTTKPGWKTERGKIYIILGKPTSIESYGNVGQVVPTEVWFYQRDSNSGIPSNFYVVFFQEEGIGDYILYSPVRHGPKKLLEGYFGDPKQAYYILKRIDRELANISYSLIPGETTEINPQPSISSEVLLNKIAVYPQKQIKDQYAEKLLKYKEFVEVDYTVNYIDNDSIVKIIANKEGFFTVHYAIEPERLSIYSYEDKYSSNLEVFGKISDLKGKTIYQFQKAVPLEFTPEQLPELKAKRFSFQDVFPLIPGNYRFDLLIKNTISKEFTSIEKNITIPQYTASLQMSSLILSHKVRKYASKRHTNRAFQFGNLQVYPPAQKNFTAKDTLFVYFQIHGLTEELKKNGIIEFSIFKEDEKVLTMTKEIKEYENKTDFLQKFSLDNYRPGIYAIQASLLNKNMNKILVEKEEFLISPVALIPRAWSLSETIPPSDDPLYLYILGNQLLNKGETENAKILLEKAYRKKPQSLKFALGFTSAIFIMQEYQKIKELLSPFLGEAEKEPAIYFYLGKSCQMLGQFEEAISYYKEYLSHLGTHLGILNSIGECYYQMGNKKEALLAWEKSLEIDPKQENIRKIVDSLKKKQNDNSEIT